jgi:hypothetical protein
VNAVTQIPQEAALDWREREESLAPSTVLNACRAWMWLETGEWSSKGEAAAWLRERVRERIEEERP